MCPRCEGLGTASDSTSHSSSTTQVARRGRHHIPGWTTESVFTVMTYNRLGRPRPNKPIRKYTKSELHDFPPPRTDAGEGQRRQRDLRGADSRGSRGRSLQGRESLQPHIRAFVDRAVTFNACPDCGGTRLSEAARSSKIKGINIADACAMQISDLAGGCGVWPNRRRAPLLASLGETLDSFAEIGLGYLSLDRSSGTLSGGEAQRVKMIRHLGSSLTRRHLRLRRASTGLHPP